MRKFENKQIRGNRKFRNRHPTIKFRNFMSFPLNEDNSNITMTADII